MATAALAEYFYCTASAYQSADSLTVTNISAPFFAYFAPSVDVTVGEIYQCNSTTFDSVIGALEGWGDAFLRRVKYHTPADGHLAEEFNRNTGIPQGAVDLTWSYASLLTASFARAEHSGNSDFVKNLADFGY